MIRGGRACVRVGLGSRKEPGVLRGACAWWEGGVVHLDLEAEGGLGPGLEPGGCCQFSIFSAFQVSHEFAINFNPTNPFCSGECQAHLRLPWFSHLAISVGGGRAEYRFLAPSPLPFHSRLLRMTDEEGA